MPKARHKVRVAGQALRLKRSKKWTRFPTRLATIPQVRQTAGLYSPYPWAEKVNRAAMQAVLLAHVFVELDQCIS